MVYHFIENQPQNYGASPATRNDPMTQVNTHCLNSSQLVRPVLDLPTPEGQKAELTLVMVEYRDDLQLKK